MKPSIKYTLLMLILTVSFSLNAATGSQKEPGSGDSISTEHQARPLFNFFGSEDLLEINLQFNMREFIRTRLEIEKKFDARLTVYNKDDNSSLSQDIKLNA